MPPSVHPKSGSQTKAQRAAAAAAAQKEANRNNVPVAESMDLSPFNRTAPVDKDMSPPAPESANVTSRPKTSKPQERLLKGAGIDVTKFKGMSSEAQGALMDELRTAEQTAMMKSFNVTRGK